MIISKLLDIKSLIFDSRSSAHRAQSWHVWPAIAMCAYRSFRTIVSAMDDDVGDVAIVTGQTDAWQWGS